MPEPVRPVILSGGSGTRLWPLSTRDSPKQFIDLLGGSLFEATLRRVARLDGSAPPLIVTGRDHLSAVDRGVAAVGLDLEAVLVEPEGRNTAPAVIAAALVSDPGDVMLVLPADHVITDHAGFDLAVSAAAEMARSGSLVLFGSVPGRPETGYGYIEIGEPTPLGNRVASFKEKPDQALAEQYLSGGRHLWNSGMFAFSAAVILEECESRQPELLESVRNALPASRGKRIELSPRFAEAPAISLDHALIEQTARAEVVPIDIGWSDVGSWEAVWEVSPRDDEGNATSGEVVLRAVTGSYIRATSRRVAVLGVDDMIVIETPEAVLVVPRSSSQMVREVAEIADRDFTD